MDNRFLANAGRKLTIFITILISAVHVYATELSDTSKNQNVQDSLAKNKLYQRLERTARFNEPKIMELKKQLNNTNAQMQELQESCLEQNIKKINRIYVLGNFFTSKQLEQINQELNAMGNDMPLTDKSTLHDLHIILLRLGITTNQLPLSGKPVIKSKYNELDLRYFGTWVFVDFDKNNLYQQYENLVKHLHDAPDTYEFSLLRALAAEYTSKIEKLALAKQQALDIKNSILEFYSK